MSVKRSTPDCFCFLEFPLASLQPFFEIRMKYCILNDSAFYCPRRYWNNWSWTWIVQPNIVGRLTAWPATTCRIQSYDQSWPAS